jgi:hypothetical protein
MAMVGPTSGTQPPDFDENAAGRRAGQILSEGSPGPSLSLEQRRAEARLWFEEFADFSDAGRLRLAMREAGSEWSEFRGFRPGCGPFRDADGESLVTALSASVVDLADRGVDLFCCPYPHVVSRSKRGATARRHVHADVDGSLRMEAVRGLGAMAVASGSLAEDGSPRGHVYLRLSESVDPDTHTALCRGLGETVGGQHADPSKVSDEDVLRPAGTLNWKGTGPSLVRWLVRPDGPGVRTWAPEDLARLLGVHWPVVTASATVSDGMELLEDEPETTSSAAPSTNLDVRAGRLEGLLRAVGEAPQGEGNSRLNWAAGKAAALGAGEASKADLVAAYLSRPIPAGETVASRRAEAARTVASGWRWGLSHPGRALTDAPADPISVVLPEGETDELALSSWSRLELRGFAQGERSAPEPELLPRTDGVGLLYRGLTHSLHGESESGKSLVMQTEAVRILSQGGRVLYLDFESDPASVAGRLLEFGASLEDLDRFAYVRPEVKPDTSAADAAAFLAHLTQPYDLAVIDGTTDALALWGAETKDNDGVTRWARALPKRIADATGAAVVMVDHVTKDSDSRGRFAIGAQAKLAALTGAAYTVEVAQPLGRGLRGVIVLRVAKDRPGSVRGHAGAMRASDRTQEMARVVVDSTGPAPEVTVQPPATGTPDAPREWRPTGLMEKISRELEVAHDGLSGRQVWERVRGKKELVSEALRHLVAAGHVSVSSGPRNSTLHRIVKAYRQAEDPDSDRYAGGLTVPQIVGDTDRPQASATVPRPLGAGDGGTVTHRPRGTVGGQSGDGAQRSSLSGSPSARLPGEHRAAAPSDAAPASSPLSPRTRATPHSHDEPATHGEDRA